MLQWVHGPITVVMMRSCRLLSRARLTASMGPRSDNRGYACWRCPAESHSAVASMGPRSENRGYGRCRTITVDVGIELQWVHGPRTVVMTAEVCDPAQLDSRASMGPRSENRGYARPCRLHRSAVQSGFNGSTVREPWLCATRQASLRSVHGFNGSTVREPWLCAVLTDVTVETATRFNGSTVREPWLCSSAASMLTRHRTASMGPRSENRGYGRTRPRYDGLT